MKKIILIAAIAVLVACGADAISAKKTITKKSSSTTTTATAKTADAISGATSIVGTVEEVPECCEGVEEAVEEPVVEPVAEAEDCCEGSSKKCCGSGSGACHRAVADSTVLPTAPIELNEAVAVDSAKVSRTPLKAKTK